jgi:DNA-binding MarR family transcriptional regulator
MTTEQLGEEVRTAVRRLYSRLRSVRSEGELGESAVAVLTQLDKLGPMSLGELSEAARVTAASMSQTVNRLTQGGFAVREKDPSDGRRVLFLPTGTGRAVAAESRRRRRSWLNARLDELDAGDRATLERAAAILQRIADSKEDA